MARIIYRVTHGQPVIYRPPITAKIEGALINSAATTGATSIAWSYVSSCDEDEESMDIIARLWSQGQ
jgi:hypothetical protein